MNTGVIGPPESKIRVTHQNQGAIQSELHTKMIFASQDKSAFHSVWKMVKFKEVFPDKTSTARSVS